VTWGVEAERTQERIDRIGRRADHIARQPASGTGVIPDEITAEGCDCPVDIWPFGVFGRVGKVGIAGYDGVPQRQIGRVVYVNPAAAALSRGFMILVGSVARNGGMDDCNIAPRFCQDSSAHVIGNIAGDGGIGDRDIRRIQKHTSTALAARTVVIYHGAVGHGEDCFVG